MNTELFPVNNEREQDHIPAAQNGMQSQFGAPLRLGGNADASARNLAGRPTYTRNLHNITINDNLADAPNAALGTPSSSVTAPLATCAHTVAVDSPRPRRGRPPGSGYKQKRAAALALEGVAPPAKRPRGRPKKQKLASPAVSIEFRTSTNPGTSRITPPALLAPPYSFVPPSRSSNHSPRPSVPPQLHSGQLVASNPCTTRPPPSTHTTPPHDTIIGSEDPQREIVPLDDDDASGDGVGVEDDLDDDEDCPSPLSSGAPMVKPLPEWLMEQFRQHLKESRQRDANGLPPLYANQHTFWFPTKSVYFILRNSSHPSPPDCYDSRFMLWDPLPLCNDGISCPKCGRRLQRHSEIPRPRRCVDMDSTFYIIGYRYRCPTCIYSKPGTRTVTFRSWDPEILKMLPSSLAAEFPARISYRSAISKTAFNWLRTCIQNGMGTKQFSDGLRTQHLLRHDLLNLQYLTHLCERRNTLDGTWNNRKFESFLPFNDTSPRGRHGYIPSAQWIRDMYDSFIEKHGHDFNQHTAMLTGEICAIDHSHKITKHLARVEGEQVFTGLLTVTNEKGEIRTCNLVATKAQSQSELPLKAMAKSLDLYGHSQPQLFFTDNITDKAFLERCFPSLRAGVVPVEKYADLEPFELPPQVKLLPKDSPHSINDAARSILDDVPQDQGYIAVGFDSEWNVELSSRGHVTHRGKTAIIQIAYQDCIYVLQISEMLAKGDLPHQLKLLLAHPRILKVGRMIKSDLSYLQKASNSSYDFVGGVDLGKLAKDRLLISNISKTSLADLCARILHKRLDKNVPERISNLWENIVLSPEQLSYAAKDAYASLCLYKEMQNIKVPSLLPSLVEPCMPVILFSNDNTTIIAEGQISRHARSQTYDGIKVSARRTVIDVLKVLVPGAIIPQHRRQTLKSFGQTPFSIVCLQSHLRLYDPAASSTRTIKFCESASSEPETETPYESASIFQDADSECDFAAPNDSEPSCSVGDLLSDDLSEGCSTDSVQGFEVDPESVLFCKEYLGKDPDQWDYTLHSRVIKDVWHVFHMFYIPATHGLRKQFTRDLRDAIFIPDKDDKDRIDAIGATWSPPQTYEQLRNSRSEWVRQRCKHHIPSPHIVYEYLAKVFRTYGPLRDPKTKKPLFSVEGWKTAKCILELAIGGYLSDPPGIPLYTRIGTDKSTGLPIYRCARGTNTTEGGVHTHIRSRLPKFGTSFRHMQACLKDFVLRHNLQTGTYNSTGQPYRSHFSIWIINKLQELTISLDNILINPVQIDGWVNGNLYSPTTEVLGILPIPESIRTATGMLPYNSNTVIPNQPQMHQYLANIQGTRKPVLPVHTATEKKLFHDLIKSHAAFSPVSGEPQWRDAVPVWNAKADITNDVSYKLVEQLSAYYNKWKTLSHIHETLSLTADIRGPLSIIIHDPSRSRKAPVVPFKPCPQPLTACEGLLETNDNGNRMLAPLPITTNAMHVDSDLPSQQLSRDDMASRDIEFWRETDVISAPQQLEHQQMCPTSPRSHQLQNKIIMEKLARQRVVESLQKTKPIKKPRKRRTCRKCGQRDCSGSSNVNLCRNRCQDCGQYNSCKGRNTKRPTKKCYEGWN
uniref:3'-5' exonuclease n=1 Tax=Psilocybe cubensis TaxID=181762 RepID=A0A8H8CGB6_PSICU